MNSLPTSNGETASARIGALEFNNGPAGICDGALEHSAGYLHAGPSSTPALCHATFYSGCRSPDDSMLEAAGAIRESQPRSFNPGLLCFWRFSTRAVPNGSTAPTVTAT